MATNLRLRPEVAEAVRAAALQSGRSQQDLIRDAIDRYLALTSASKPERDLSALIAPEAVRPSRTPYRKPARRLTLPAGVTSADLMDRDDRF